MPDLQSRLERLRVSADATLLAEVSVSSALKARVLRTISESPGGAAPVPVRMARRRSDRAHALGLALAVALAVLIAFELWPKENAKAAASLTVRPIGSPFVVSVGDAHVLAGEKAVVALRDGTTIERYPVEVDTLNSQSYRWSPDGRLLAFGNRGDLFVYDTKTKKTTNVTRTPGRWELLPSWSPDGTWLAFTSRPLVPGEGPDPNAPNDPDWIVIDGPGYPTVVRADGTGYRVLDRVPVTSAPSWSPDGRTLAFASDGVVEGDFPDQTRAARRDGVVYLADVASRRLRRLTPSRGRGAGYIGAPSWSPTRPELALFFSESDREPSRKEMLSNTAPRVRQGYALLDLRRATLSNVYSYTGSFVPRGQAAWSDDGELLALNFRQETAIAEPTELVVVTWAGKVELRLPGGLFSSLAWEPGEHRLVVRDDGDPASVILVTVGEGGADVQRLRFDSGIEGAAWRRGRP